jgi:PAS domain S-box-containing protein
MVEKYRNLYDNSPDLYRTINLDGIILDRNTTYASRLGYTKDEVIGRTIFEHVTQDSLETLQDAHHTWKKTGIVTSAEIWLKRKNNSAFPVLLSAAMPSFSWRILVGSNIAMRDMTDMHNAKKRD